MTTNDYYRPEPKRVIGPNGNSLTVSNLPAPGTKRWVFRVKAEIVAAVRGGLLSLEEACRRYMLTVEEFRTWEYSIERHGLSALRVTRIQLYRQRAARFRLPDSPSRRRYRSRERQISDRDDTRGIERRAQLVFLGRARYDGRQRRRLHDVDRHRDRHHDEQADMVGADRRLVERAHPDL
jgi:Protein of unknown function (DUF1153)